LLVAIFAVPPHQNLSGLSGAGIFRMYCYFPSYPPEKGGNKATVVWSVKTVFVVTTRLSTAITYFLLANAG